MPPSILDLNQDVIVKRDSNNTMTRPDFQDEPLAVTSAGPMVGFALGGLVVILLISRLFWWISLQIKIRHPPRRQARAWSRRSLSDRILQSLHKNLPRFVSCRLPAPAPATTAGLSNPPIDLHYPARSIDTLPPYPGFSAPISPADSRRFLYLMPIMPLVDMFSRRPAPGSNAAITSVSPTLVDGTAPDGMDSELPPDYTSLTPPYTTTDASVIPVPEEAHLSRSGQDEWRTLTHNHV